MGPRPGLFDHRNEVRAPRDLAVPTRRASLLAVVAVAAAGALRALLRRQGG